MDTNLYNNSVYNFLFKFYALLTNNTEPEKMY